MKSVCSALDMSAWCRSHAWARYGHTVIGVDFDPAKLGCNNFHALKITFANETARLCEALDVDAFEVMALLCKDRQLNISPAYQPGFVFGGSCLPKDLRATMYLAKLHDVELPMLGSVLPSNRAHVEHAIAKVLASSKVARGHDRSILQRARPTCERRPHLYSSRQHSEDPRCARHAYGLSW